MTGDRLQIRTERHGQAPGHDRRPASARPPAFRPGDADLRKADKPGSVRHMRVPTKSAATLRRVGARYLRRRPSLIVIPPAGVGFPAAGRGRGAAAFCIAVIVSLAWGALPVIVIHRRDILCCPVLGRTGLCAGTESEAGSGSPSGDVPADHVTAVLTALFDLTRAMNMAEQHNVVGQVRGGAVGQTARAKEIRRLQVIRQITHLNWDALPGIGFDAEDLPGHPAG
jgi:hypothetical protein